MMNTSLLLLTNVSSLSDGQAANGTAASLVTAIAVNNHNANVSSYGNSKASIQIDQPVFFVETMSSWYWLATAVGLSLLTTFIFSHAHIPKVTPRRLGMVNLLMSVMGVVPFVFYIFTKITWTGTSLSALHRRMIDNSHAILMFGWAILSLLQVLTIILKKYKLHVKLGKFGLNVLMPTILIELNVNAARVFFPSKPAALAQGYWPIDAAEPTWWHVLIFSFPMASALLTTVMMAMYWWLSRSTLYDTKRYPDKATRIRLHMTYSTLLMVVINSAGIVRWIFRMVYTMTDCPKFTHDIVSVAVQQLSTSYNGFLHLPLVALIYATVPMEMRQQTSQNTTTTADQAENGPAPRDVVKSLKCSFYAYLVHALLQFVSSFLLDIPFAFQCNREAIDTFLVLSSAY